MSATKRCFHCDHSFDLMLRQGDYAGIVNHYLKTHPDSPRLAELVGGVEIDVECQGCGRSMTSTVSISTAKRSFHVDMYCRGCIAEHRLKKLFVRELSAEELLARDDDDQITIAGEGAESGEADRETGGQVGQ